MPDIQNVTVRYVVDDQGLLKSQTETSEGFKKVNTEAANANDTIKKGTTESVSASKLLSGELKNAAGNINIMGVNAGDAFNKVNSGLGGAVRGLGLFKVALIGTGIGAFLVALGSLVAYFKSTEKGSEQIERAMAGIGAAVKVVIGRFADLGAGLVSFFTGDFSGATKLFKQAFSDIGDEISSSTQSAVEFTGALQDVKMQKEIYLLLMQKEKTRLIYF